MQRKRILLATSVVISTLLTGCMNHQGDQTARNMNAKSSAKEDMRLLSDDRTAAENKVANHMNGKRLTANRTMGDRISGLEGIHKAYVYVDGADAYVALSLHPKAQANAKRGTAGDMNHGVGGTAANGAKMSEMNAALSKTKNTYGMNGTSGTSGNYGMNGMYFPGGPYMYGPKASNTMNGAGNGRSLDGSTLRHPYGMTQLSQHTGEGLIQYSHALTARNNTPSMKAESTKSSASSADGHASKLFGLDRKAIAGSSVPADMKQRITKEIRSLSPNVKRVHISTDPDFMYHMKVYRGYLKIDHRYMPQP